MTEDTLRLRVLDAEDLATAQELGGREQGDLTVQALAPAQDEYGGLVEPISFVLVAGAATLMAKFVVDWWDRRRGGLVIDQRPGSEDELRRDPDVPYGHIVVYPADGGNATIEVKDLPKDAMERLLTQVLSGVLPSVSAVGEAAEAAGGASAR